jgi:hypothetical protein
VGSSVWEVLIELYVTEQVCCFFGDTCTVYVAVLCVCVCEGVERECVSV